MLMMLTFLACSDPPPLPKPEVKPPPVEAEPEPEPVAPNKPPKIGTFSLSPDDPTTDTTLQATVSASDPEGLVVDVDYQWSVNGRELLTESTQRLKPRNFKRGDVVVFKALVSDGEHEITRSARITIGNASPIFISDPRGVRQLDGFQLSVSDPDGDAVRFRIEDAPRGMSVDSSRGIISYQGSVDEPGGSYDIRIVAEDPDKAQAVWEFSVDVSAGSPGSGEAGG